MGPEVAIPGAASPDTPEALDAEAMLARAGIDATPVRLAVVRVLAREGRALPAGDILALVLAEHSANKVTV